MASSPEGREIAHERIAREKAEKTGFLDLGRLGLDELPKELLELEWLEVLNLGSAWTDAGGNTHNSSSSFESNSLHELPGGVLPQLRALHLRGARQLEMSVLPPELLERLEILDCSETHIFNLRDLGTLKSLRSLNCSRTNIESLEALTNFTCLEFLNCAATRVASLDPLAGLRSLRSLHCAGTPISSLVPLAEIASLETLSCHRTQITSLYPLTKLSSLRSLNIYGNEVASLEPLARFSFLEELYCAETRVDSLEPLAGATSLKTLDCNRTQIDSLEPLVDLPSLSVLDARNCRISFVPDALVWRESLSRLRLAKNPISDIPLEILDLDNCLESLRAYRQQQNPDSPPPPQNPASPLPVTPPPPPPLPPKVTTRYRTEYLLQGLSEQPTDQDALGVEPYAIGLANFLSAKKTQTPLTISVEGPWGMGKTSFLKMVRKALTTPPPPKQKSAGDPSLFQRLKQWWEAPRHPPTPAPPAPKIVWFNPWRHDAGEALWAAFLYEFSSQMERSLGFWERQRASLAFAWAAMHGRRRRHLSFACVVAVISFVTWKGMRIEDEKDKADNSKSAAITKKEKEKPDESKPVYLWLLGLAGIPAALCPLILDYWKGLKKDAEQVWKKDDEKARFCAAEKASGRLRKFLKAYLRPGQRIYVMIDDLDRCAPPRAAEMLDSLDLLISGNGGEAGCFPIVFLLALDREKVAAGVAVKYKELLPFVGSGLPKDEKLLVHAGREFGYEYLQKFIDVPFRLPSPGGAHMETFIAELARENDPGNAGAPAEPKATGPSLKPAPGDLSPEARAKQDSEEAERQTEDLSAALKKPAETDPEAALRKVEEARQTAEEVFRNLDMVEAMTAVAPMLDNNPRRVKQYLNLLRLRIHLAASTGLFAREVLAGHLAKTVAVELARPVLFRRLCENPSLRDDLSKVLQQINDAPSHDGLWAAIEPRLRDDKLELSSEDCKWLQRYVQSMKLPVSDPASRFPDAALLSLIFEISAPPSRVEAAAAQASSPPVPPAAK